MGYQQRGGLALLPLCRCNGETLAARVEGALAKAASALSTQTLASQWLLLQNKIRSWIPISVYLYIYFLLIWSSDVFSSDRSISLHVTSLPFRNFKAVAITFCPPPSFVRVTVVRVYFLTWDSTTVFWGPNGVLKMQAAFYLFWHVSRKKVNGELKGLN